MNNIQKSVFVVLSVISFGIFAEQTVTADQVIGAMEKQFGVTAGQRRNHINGVCLAGSFVGDKSIQAYSTSPLFSGKAIPVIGRFSLAGGSLKTPDTARSSRAWHWHLSCLREVLSISPCLTSPSLVQQRQPLFMMPCFLTHLIQSPENRIQRYKPPLGPVILTLKH